MVSFSRSRALRRLLSPLVILTQRLSCCPNNANRMERGNRVMGYESNPVSNFLKSIHCFPMPLVKSPAHEELIDTVPIRSLQRMSKSALEFGNAGLLSRSFTVRKVSYLRSIYCFNFFQLPAKSENPGTQHVHTEAVSSGESSTRSDAYAANELALDAVVKVFTVTSSPNYFLPWQNKPQRELTGSGFVISGRRILTNAHVVADQTFVLVRKHGSPTKYRAEVQAVGHECDLALLTVNNEEFWEGVNFLEFGNIPYLQEAVAVVGYPQ
ncbi:hypothetical protein KI387_043232, partial [Taxus chinensis]